jgi:uncharacterized sporulation protein YeaH/YhbH (DUF444 family)
MSQASVPDEDGAILSVSDNPSMKIWESQMVDWLNNPPERERPSIVLPKQPYLDRTVVDRWRFMERAKPKINKDVLKHIIRGDSEIFRNVFVAESFEAAIPGICLDPATKRPPGFTGNIATSPNLIYVPAIGLYDDIEVPIGIDEPNWWPGRDKPGGGGSGNDASDDEGDLVYLPITYEEFLELVQLLFDLPFLKQTDMDKLLVHTYKMRGLKNSGPMVRWDKTATAIERIKRFKATVNANPNDYPEEWRDPDFIPSVEEFPFHKIDMKYKQVQEKWDPDSKAVIFYELDTSGSMSGEPLALAKFFFLITLIWLKTRYKEVSVVYIAHNAEAHRVSSEKDFFQLDAGYGTMFVPAHELVLYLGTTEFGGGNWNRYCLHATDGWGFDGVGEIRDAIERIIRAGFNYFGYLEVRPSNWADGGSVGMDAVRSVSPDVAQYVGYSKASQFEDVPKALQEMMDKDRTSVTE